MGELTRSGEYRRVNEGDLDHFRQAQALQRLQRAPVLQGPHGFVFLGLFDGTGQDADNPRQARTNIGILREQAVALADDSQNRAGYRYQPGIGTQDDFTARWLDRAIAFSWDQQLQSTYAALTAQTKLWKKQDSTADVTVIAAGYSRGAVLAAGLTRLVDRFGIADPDQLSFGRDAQGNVTVRSPRPPLVAPRDTAQVVVLYDPVGTGFPAQYDARLPPSVIGGTAFVAMDERRSAFAHLAILDPGLSADRRFANLPVPGGHSNAGGGNRDAGLETGTFNLSVDYLNAVAGRDLFQYRTLPDDPSRYTAYQVRGVTAVPGLDGDGVRDLREQLANCKVVDPCRDSEGVDERLASRFDFRPVQVRAPVPTAAHLGRAEPRHASHAPVQRERAEHPEYPLLQQIRRGVEALDRSAGRPYDDRSERLSRSLLAAVQGGGNGSPLERVDHVVLGHDARNAFAVQGALHDPAHRRVHVRIEDALRTPVEALDARIEAAHQARQPALHSPRQGGQAPAESVIRDAARAPVPSP